MKFCQKHWNMARKAIADRGMDGLVAKSGEKAVENIKAELAGEEAPFDPLMSMNLHWMNAAMREGGLYLMGTDENGNPYCPVCEFEKHVPGFVAEESIGIVADQMRTYSEEQGLIPKVQ